MTVAQIALVPFSLALLLTVAHMLGHVAARLRQPRLVGEIVAGVVPFAVGRLVPGVSEYLFGRGPGHPTAITLDFLSWLGLLLLMFLSGTEVRRVLAGENRRASTWIFGVGTAGPFLGVLILFPALPLDQLSGPAARPTSVLLVLAIAVAVTSIPVISRIFHDLGILRTQFASLVLSVAIVEDIALWALLAVAISLSVASVGVAALAPIVQHLALTVAYIAVALLVAPHALKRLHRAPWNLVARASNSGYALLILLAYTSAATVLGVNLVFAAFTAGFGLIGGFDGSESARFGSALHAISRVSFAVFIPLYFVFVGYQLGLGHGFSTAIFVGFLVGSSLLRVFSVALASRCAGFRGMAILNLAIVMNARGGPGIVLATVTHSAGIISGTFFTTLVITAILTSQIAAAWLGYVLGRGWPLLSGPVEASEPKRAALPVALDRPDDTTSAG